MSETLEKERLLELSNKIFNFFALQRVGLLNFGFYLFDKEFSKEIELRNKLGAIWICSLYDCLDGETRVLPSLAEESKALNQPTLITYCDTIKELCSVIKIFFSSLSIAEQLFLQDYRNQLVHTWGHNIFQIKVSVRYVEKEIYVRKTMDRQDYRNLVGSIYNFGVDYQLQKILGPIWTKDEHLLSGILNVFGRPGNIDTIQSDIFSWDPDFRITGGPH